MAKGFSENNQQNRQQTETVETNQVNYQGKTPEGYSAFAAQASVQNRFQLANEISANEAEQLLQDAAYLTARRVEQDKASGNFVRRVASHLVTGNDAESAAKAQLREQVNAHFSSQEIDSDFFTKALQSSPSTRLLAGVQA